MCPEDGICSTLGRARDRLNDQETLIAFFNELLATRHLDAAHAGQKQKASIGPGGRKQTLSTPSVPLGAEIPKPRVNSPSSRSNSNGESLAQIPNQEVYIKVKFSKAVLIIRELRTFIEALKPLLFDVCLLALFLLAAWKVLKSEWPK